MRQIVERHGGAVPRDQTLSYRWMQRAAARGHLNAMFGMGLLVKE